MKKVFDVKKDDFENAGIVSSQIKKQVKQLGYSVDIVKRIAVGAYEAEINLIIHSDGGSVTFEIGDLGNVCLLFDDCGPGIKDLDLALQPGFSTANTKARQLGFGAGMGLVNMKRVADEFTLTSSEKGTHLKMVFYG